jgi:hypothetical protein
MVRRFDAEYHRRLFDWHCRTFHPFHQELCEDERAYLEACFALARDWREVPEWGHADICYYTYSHRVAGDRANSSRIAYGSILHAERAVEAAERVLHRRRVRIDPFYLDDAGSKLYGLGWDLIEGLFKVYFRVRSLASIPDSSLQALMRNQTREMRSEGVVCFAFAGTSLHESKVYLYPEAAPPPGDTTREYRVSMLSTRRGRVEQVDVADGRGWLPRINEAGRRIVALYAEVDEGLDAIAYGDRDHYVLYFPLAGGLMQPQSSPGASSSGAPR